MTLAHHNIFVENKSTGKPLGGVIVRVYSFPGNVLQSVFADLNSTPKPLVETDTNGGADFYIADGNYDIEYIYNGEVSERLVNVPIFNPENQVNLDDLASANGDDLVGTQYPESGSKLRTFAQVATKTIELSGFTGADPTQNNDSYAAFMAFLAAVKLRKAEGVIDGAYRIQAGGKAVPTVDAPVKLVARDHRSGNVPDGSQHAGSLYFDQYSPDAILVNDSVFSMDGVALIGATADFGIRSIGENAAVRLKGGAVVQGFNIGFLAENGFYHDIENTTFAYCNTGARVGQPSGAFQAIYNFTMRNVKFVNDPAGSAGTIGLDIHNGSHVSASECSFENFKFAGVNIGTNSSANIYGCYFEGFGGYNINMAQNAQVDAFGNLVYLTVGANRWISVADGSATGIILRAGGNRIVTPLSPSTDVATGYEFLNGDTTAFSDISGDKWPVNAGANAAYIGSNLLVGTGPSTFRGMHRIIYPVGHAKQYEPINTVPLRLFPSTGAIVGTAQPTMIAPWACNGNAGDDPIGIIGTAWGANPYNAVYHKGQWEKLGLRLANITDAATEAEGLTKFNTLLAGLRAAGVMV